MPEMQTQPDETTHSDRSRLAIFTVVSNNYLHFARTLLQTVARHHPEADLFCVIVDRDLGPSDRYAGDFTVLRMDDLGLPDPARMMFQYDVLELNTAVKPWAFARLLEKGYGSVVYLDPDIFVYRPLSEVVDALKAGASIVITPHLLSPIDDDGHPGELDIRRAGSFNFGFCAVGQSATTSAFLAWWQGKLVRDCVVDLERGIFVDQSWIDLVPGLFDDVTILRDPGYNVAYWNIAQRNVTREGDDHWSVDSAPLTFFHFSGFDPLAPKGFSKHQDRFTLANLGPAADLARDYAAAVIANGAETFAKLPYGFNDFSDGTPIPRPFRRLYLENETLRASMGDDPFEGSAFLTGIAEGPGVVSLLPITWAMFAVYRKRTDLQSAFDLLDMDGAFGFRSWFITGTSNEVSSSLQDLHWNSALETNRMPGPAEIACHTLYADLLDRSPTQREYEAFRTLCETRLGTSIALLRLSRAAESRNRPRPTRRFKAALRGVWQSRRRARGLATLTLAPPQAQPKTIDGIFPPEPRAAVDGLWCGQHVSIPLGPGEHRRVAISGVYEPDLVRQANGTGELHFDLRLDGRFWKRVDLTGDGSIDIGEDLPDHLVEATTLQIGADTVFVPSAHGDNPDGRGLAWRVKRIAVDGTEIVDSRRDPPFLSMQEVFRPSGFNLIGYIRAESGVGEAVRTMALAADAAAIPYSLTDVGYQTVSRQADRRAESKAVEEAFAIDVVYVNADQTRRTLVDLAKDGRPSSAYRIGFWHWEQPRLPEVYWQGFEGLDEVWVPTAFVQEAVSAVSPVPVFKVPHAVDFRVSPDWTRESFGIPADRFAVLVMYDFHSYRVRKNPEAAIAAFERASAGREDMVLVIKTINASGYAEDYAALKAEVAGTSVVFIDEVFSRDQIYALEACCDCMLSLHRAEGFGFGPAEMMFLGKPVIATGWSGNMEFMTPHNSFPVDYELVPLKAQLGAYAAGIDWAEPDVDHAAACLRRVVEDRALAREVGARARQTMLTKFSPAVIGQHYRERLALIGMRL